MAELINVGEHCGFSECHQLDFLPIECLLCHKLFCKLHIKASEHACKVEASSKILTEEEVKNLEVPVSFQCYLSECKGRELTAISCEECREQFCLKHRLPCDHNCTQIQPKEKRKYEGMTSHEKVEKITGKSLTVEKSTGRVGKKSSKTASKVVEMKLKMKAKGETSIPVDERVYFDVKINIDSCSVKSIPLFFSREFTIGRTIDLIAKYTKIKNENHVANAPKLRLYVTEGVYFAVDQKLSKLLEGEDAALQNFGNINLHYVI